MWNVADASVLIMFSGDNNVVFGLFMHVISNQLVSNAIKHSKLITAQSHISDTQNVAIQNSFHSLQSTQSVYVLTWCSSARFIVFFQL